MASPSLPQTTGEQDSDAQPNERTTTQHNTTNTHQNQQHKPKQPHTQPHLSPIIRHIRHVSNLTIKYINTIIHKFS